MGRELAGHLAGQGDSVVLTGRDAERARQVAREVGKGRQNVRGIALDLAEPHEIARALSGTGPVDHLVITAVERDVNSVRDYSVERAVRLATLKVVGYTVAVAALREVLAPTGSVVLFGGVAKDAPYPGSTTVTAVNGAVVSMVRTLSTELAPVRVNAVHPGIASRASGSMIAAASRWPSASRSPSAGPPSPQTVRAREATARRWRGAASALATSLRAAVASVNRERAARTTARRFAPA
ncbi:SDR family NAD(P)-dependent oxidoreductase [Streptomyces goshikiensis]|uniref:SDR family NAD(P)-dependent oxidoreductase n=1 Tax=Streptomyces goshikiensis TaxID=1942 RepID=UPI0036C01424